MSRAGNDPTPDGARYDPESSKSQPSEMRLHPDRPAVTRLSRRVLVGLGCVAAAGIAGVLFFSLKPQIGMSGTELYNTANRSTPEGLQTLPHDYTGLPRDVPKLGPPLPGDLGKPMFNAGMSAPGMPEAEQRLAQEQDAARTSHLFATTGVPSTPVAAEPNPSRPTASSTPGAADAADDRKLAFLNASTDRRTETTDRIERPAGADVVQAGSVIPAALVTGLRSDLPGEITAQVTQDVYDTPTGHILLIPQGARLIGQYDAQITFGQSRALLVWNRLIMPNGHSIVLERQPGVDTAGYAGLEDEVDNHWGALFEAAILSTVLSVGSEAGTSNNENNLAQAIRQGASQSFNQTGEQVVARSLNVQPTITIRPGFPLNVLVTRDLLLEPYRT